MENSPEEVMYVVGMDLVEELRLATSVGIPKPGQNRNLDVIREVE